MTGMNVKPFVNLFLVLVLCAVSAMTAHAFRISDNNVVTEPLDVVGDVNASGSITANSFSGSGADLTNISGTNITSGTVSELLIDSLICRDSEVTSAISTHATNSSAHHQRYTNTEAVSAVLAADGPDSGLNADLLDGQHASGFASATHEHDTGVSFLKLNGPGYRLRDDVGFLEVSWYPTESITLVGPGTFVVDFGGKADCESSGGLHSWVKVFPTLDGEQVPGEEAILDTLTYIQASFAQAVQISIMEGTHYLRVGVKGRAYNIASPGCLLSTWWIKATLMY
jgi:hypothetical protein